MMLIFLFFLGLLSESKANEITVVDVRRNITLSDDEPIYKDFYINAGPGSGLKKNLVVTAVRKLNVRDASGANAVGELLVPVGQLRIIAVYERVAVAREYSLLSRDELPMLEQIGIMNGDRIDLQGAFIDKPKPKGKKQVSEQPPPAPPSPSAVAVAVKAPVETAKPKGTAETLEKTAASDNNSGYE